MRGKTRQQLGGELAEAHRRIAELEKEKAQRTRTEQALRASEDRLSKIMMAANDGMWDWDLKTDVVYFDPRYYEMAGYEVDAFPHRLEEFQERVHPDDLDAVMAQAQRHLDGESDRFMVEFRFRRKSGDWLWVMGRGVIVERDQHGTPLRFVGTHTNITERKQAEAELQESREQYRLLVENQTDLIVKVDTEGRFEFVSPSYCELFGKTEAALLGRTFMPLVHEEDRTRTAQAMEALHHPPYTAYVEQRALTVSGWRWLGWLDTAVRDERGEVTAIIGVGRDITERKRAEQALNDNEVFLDSIFESIQDGISVLDLDLNILRVNSVMKEWYAESMPLEGNPCYRSYHGRSEPCSPCPTLAALASGRTESGIVPGLPGSDITWVELYSYPIKDPEDGAITGVVEFVRDVTERRAMEDQLRHQERLAAVGQLASGIAHDFNNLLATTILYAQLPLKRHPDLPIDVRRALNTILHESHRAADLIQQILDFTRNAMLETELLNLADFAGKVINVLQRTIPENIQLRFDMTPRGCMVDADPTRIQQALTNLALNARDAMPEGGELRIAVQPIEVQPEERPPVAGMNAGRWARLTVSDTGAGMTEAVQAHLFEPFFTTKEPGEGTGLGLAQVLGIVKQHDGYIDVKTAEGEGTTFTLFLPIAEAVESDQSPEGERRLPRGRGETILVVEDAKPLREGVKAELELLGYRVITAINGLDALQITAAHKIDLMLTDLVMPKMGGERLLSALRDQSLEPKAIAMTGHFASMDAGALRAAGFTNLITKPFSTEELAILLRNTLDDPS